MKIQLLTIGIALFSVFQAAAQPCTAPTANATLHGNDVRCNISNTGGLFMDANQMGVFQVPYNANAATQTNTIYTSALWIAGYDDGGNLVGALRMYGQNGTDYFAGPLNDSTGATNQTECNNYNKVWQIDRARIEAHIQDFNDDGVIQNADSVLLSWPGLNNPNFQALMGFALPANRNLAPFYDHNNDGVYDPYSGDYPVFKENGDPTAIAEDLTWTIFNDNGNMHTESNMLPIFVEVHQTTYALSCSGYPLLNRTIFVRHKLTSRNNLEIRDVRAGIFVDFDLGNYQDDYMGTDSLNNAVFAYNADNMDETTQVAGFGEKPPVQSVMMLNRNIDHSAAFTNSNDTVSGNPFGRAYHYVLDGRYNNGTVPPFNFAYSAPPTDTNSMAFSMANLNVTPADHRMVMSVNIDTFSPGEVYEIETAYVYHRDTTLADNIQMTTLLASELPQVQNWYDNGFPAACFPAQTLALREALNAKEEVRLFPNPNNGRFTLKFGSAEAHQLLIFNAAGQLVLQQTLEGAEQYELQLPEVATGLYFYQLQTNDKLLKTGKFICK